ncbi:Pyridoxal-dependent decarboxylase, pyridoxal binding domain protein [Ostertagia ostertagi]
MKGGVYQHDGTLEVEDYARGITESYDNKGIQDPFSIIDLDVVKRNLDLWNRALPSVKGLFCYQFICQRYGTWFVEISSNNYSQSRFLSPSLNSSKMKSSPYYAIKCNPDLNILRTLSAHGACFDCASLQEMDTILSNGLADGEDIILAHPIKSRRCIEYAIRNGVTLMTFDSVEELRKIVSTTSKAMLILRIRVSGFESLVDLNKKFGADETTSKLILHEAARLGAKIHGISFHIGSGVENCQPLALSLANARNLLDYGRMLGHPISILDIGGGFMNSSPQKFLKVGNFIENTLSSCFEGISITVIAEPGRFLVPMPNTSSPAISSTVLQIFINEACMAHSILFLQSKGKFTETTFGKFLATFRIRGKGPCERIYGDLRVAVLTS